MPKEWDWDAWWRGNYHEWAAENPTTKYTRGLDTIAWKFDGKVLSTDDGGYPLHPNTRLVFETIAQLQPKSIAEFGCGPGDNLHNIELLVPNAKLYGYDISAFALDRLQQRFPALAQRATVETHDVALELELQPVELVFTHTVIMHIIGERHLVALRNMFATAQSHVVLMENWRCHPFMSDIVELCKDASLEGWANPYFYHRFSPEFGRPHLMVVSKDADLPYERLQSYEKTFVEPLSRAQKEGRP